MTTLALLVATALATTPALPSAPLAPRASRLVPRASRSDVIDRIVAVVGGQPVTLSDVNAALAFKLVEPPPPGGDRIGATLDRVIERDLMLADVERFQPPEPAPEAINARLAATKTALGADYERQLKATGMTEDALRRELRDNIRLEIYMNQRFTGVDAAARPQLIADWIAGLRRRTEVTVLYLGR